MSDVCEVCEKPLSKNQVLHKSKTCCVSCKIKRRQKLGWFYKTPEFNASGRGSVGRCLAKLTKEKRLLSSKDSNINDE
jgi:hypothetical protein